MEGDLSSFNPAGAFSFLSALADSSSISASFEALIFAATALRYFAFDTNGVGDPAGVRSADRVLDEKGLGAAWTAAVPVLDDLPVEA